MSFTRTIEDFTCEHCGLFVPGSGYTNHCPKCLWSKHVDVEPGDRAADCKGLMQPVGLEYRKQGFIITHRCLACGQEKRNKASAEDDPGALVALSKLKP